MIQLIEVGDDPQEEIHDPRDLFKRAPAQMEIRLYLSAD